MMEHVVKEKEELFRTISDFAYDAIIMIDDNGCITYWNKAAERIFGYTRDEILGRNLHEILAPFHLYETFENAFTLFRETGDGIAIGKTLEMPFIKKDGTESVGELSISSVKIKDKWHTIGIVRDIRERKKMEEELKEKVEELENFHKVAVDRELRMIELKKEINELCEKYGEKPRYNLNVEG
ncbi:MAG TPA: PAS domain S-box protein [Thermoplasmatales archaeon]|nr:PAS domain S-box protein [Thermoplasmatales archaeon]